MALCMKQHVCVRGWSLPYPLTTSPAGRLRFPFPIDCKSALAAYHPSRFAVFLTGHASPFCTAKYGGYGQMLKELLQEPGETWDILPLVDGFQPTLEELDTYHGFVVTGSKHDAHGNDPWILKLCDILRDLHLRRKKVLGICFGHQILSRALGGKAGRAAVGWELGEREVQLCVGAFSKRSYGRDLPPMLRVIESHQDQVLELPPGAELLGFSNKTPIEIFGVGDHILAIQGHPEFEVDVIMDIIDSRMALGIVSEDVGSASKTSIAEVNPDNKAYDMDGHCVHVFYPATPDKVLKHP